MNKSHFGLVFQMVLLAFFAVVVLENCYEAIEAGEPDLGCQAEISLSIKSGVRDPFYVIRDPEEINAIAKALGDSFALPYMGPEKQVFHEALTQDIGNLYMLYIDFSGCSGIPNQIRIWKGLIVIRQHGEDGKLTKKSYFADTQGIEKKLITMGWKLGAFSDWDIKAVPEHLRPEGWKDPGN
ncbi:MAG: hypothetical protein GX421_08145 [Caldisericales bacterium]|nr:hypothetical protein [Caldisericales bacterium]